MRRKRNISISASGRVLGSLWKRGREQARTQTQAYPCDYAYARVALVKTGRNKSAKTLTNQISQYRHHAETTPRFSETVREYPVLYGKGCQDLKNRNKKAPVSKKVANTMGMESGKVCQDPVRHPMYVCIVRNIKWLRSRLCSWSTTVLSKHCEKPIWKKWKKVRQKKAKRSNAGSYARLRRVRFHVTQESCACANILCCACVARENQALKPDWAQGLVRFLAS